jgi:hypothetical protein
VQGNDYGERNRSGASYHREALSVSTNLLVRHEGTQGCHPREVGDTGEHDEPLPLS